MKTYFLIFIAFITGGCSDELTMEIGRIVALKTSSGELFFYRIVNGLSTDAYFLSKKSNVCMGFNKSEDYCFRSLGAFIYYKTNNDTLYIYTSSPAQPPDNFGFNVVQKPLEALEVHQYEEMYKNKKIQKVEIDSLYTPGCDVAY